VYFLMLLILRRIVFSTAPTEVVEVVMTEIRVVAVLV